MRYSLLSLSTLLFTQSINACLFAANGNAYKCDIDGKRHFTDSIKDEEDTAILRFKKDDDKELEWTALDCKDIVLDSNHHCTYKVITFEDNPSLAPIIHLFIKDEIIITEFQGIKLSTTKTYQGHNLRKQAPFFNNLNIQSIITPFQTIVINDYNVKAYSAVPIENLLESDSYSNVVLGYQTRRGCDHKPGSLGRIDVCGRCGGNGKRCIGCDGQLNSGAKMDQCGQCTGGTTNKSFNFLKDCAGTCNMSSTGECGKCQPINAKFRRNFKDCNGVCFGKARLNKCGVCTGGNSGKEAHSGQDACGVCGGDNSSCTGCDGVINSGKKTDLCGNCLYPNDKQFNNGCTKIADLQLISATSAKDNIIVNSN